MIPAASKPLIIPPDAVSIATDPVERELPAVIQRMVDESYEFEFFETVRILERYFPDAAPPGESFSLADQPIRFRPDHNLVFPASDIRDIAILPATKKRGEQALITVSFMGLYGVDSPLPYYFYNELSYEREDTDGLREFLDIFNNRLYAFFYRAWKKYRPGLDTRSHERFFKLTGLGTPSALETLPVTQNRLAAFAARLIGRTRNPHGLKALLERFLRVPIQILENVERWVTIDERAELGDPNNTLTLGGAATIGRRVRDVSGKFRIALGPLGLDDFRDFLPGGPKAGLLKSLAKMYVPDHLAYDLELSLGAESVPAAILGNPDLQLGRTSILGKPTGEMISRTVVDYAD